MPQKALIIQGGWPGHEPEAMAQKTANALREHAFEVQTENSIECLNDAEALNVYDLIVPVWTMGTLTGDQEKNLSNAVKSGIGLGGFHGGMTDAFRGSLDYEWMVGAHFVGHPYVGPYEITLTDKEHAIVQALPERFTYDSEQYYLMVDPAVDVLASTLYHYAGKQVDMPVVWTKQWGSGRVFCSALGHVAKEFETYPDVWKMTVRGLLWASRNQTNV